MCPTLPTGPPSAGRWEQEEEADGSVDEQHCTGETWLVQHGGSQWVRYIVLTLNAMLYYYMHIMLK